MDLMEQATEMGRTALNGIARYIDFADRQPTANVVILCGIAGLLTLALALSVYLRRSRPEPVERRREEIAIRRDPIVVERLLPAPGHMPASSSGGQSAPSLAIDDDPRLAVLEAKISTLQESFQEQANRLHKVRAALLSLESGVGGLAARLEKDEGQSDTLRKEVAALRQSIKDLQERAATQPAEDPQTSRRSIPPRRRDKLSGEIAELVEELSRA